MINSKFLQIVPLIKDVGRHILNWRNDNNARRINSEIDFKTEADNRAHIMLNRGLEELYPGIPILSEEDPIHQLNRPDAYWLLDPIDGTASWYDGYKGFVTQAAYIENNNPIFGIVHAPAFNKTWMAEKNFGAFLNNKPLSKLKSTDRMMLIDNTKTPHGIIKEMMSIMPSTGYLECGSLGLKSVLVADGTVDLFVKDVCVRDWDLAPAAVILNEVGGCLMQASGEPYYFDGSFTKDSGFIIARDSVLLDIAMDVYKKIQER